MNTEIELKFIIEPPEIAKFTQHSLIQQYLQQELSLELYNTYFDTPDFALKKRNYALRIRKYDGHILQTLKTDQKSNNELHQRQEYEFEINTEKIDSSKFTKKIQAWLEPLINQLQPIFTTNFKRKIWLLKLKDQTIIELALDQGEIKAGKNTSPICEIELELKQGSLENLLRFTRRLQQDIQLTPDATSKAEKGYKLLIK